MTHDNMSSHDIRHMTSRYDFVSMKFDIFYMSLWANWSDDFTSVSHSIQVEKYILTIADRVAFTHAFTRDLETENHVMVYVTFVISACIFVLPR